MPPNSWNLFDIAAIAYLILALLGLFLVYRLLRAIVRKLVDLWSKGSVLGGDQKSRLISLGIVALLFPGIFVGVGNALISFIGNFFVDLPRDLISNWQNAQSFCSGNVYAANFCTPQLVYGFGQAWTSAISDTLNRFGPTYIPFSRLVLMLAVWAGVSTLLNATTKESKEGSEQSTRLQAWFKRLEPAARQNMMFFLVLIVAGYLSIAAITAIPGLEESASPSETVSLAQLQRELEATLKQYVDRIPTQISFTDSPTPTMTPTRAAVTHSTATPSPNNTDEQAVPVSANKDVDPAVAQQRVYWQSQYTAFLQRANDEAEKAKNDAISSYQTSLIGRKGEKETVAHFLALEAWYRDGLSSIEKQMRSCRRLTVELDDLPVSQATSRDPAYLFAESQTRQRLLRNQTETCQSGSFFNPLPPRQELGSNLGPFSYIASWLLRTESLSLAQIVGLLGFGLLGSAVSSLVRSQKKREREQPLVNELATVIIRGATAAVVVFLAVKGGLAVFTSGESNPNSYVLLLTCLVAAVFSDKVWEETQSRFTRELQGNPKPGTDTDKDDTSPTPASTPPAPQATTGTPPDPEPGQEEPSQDPPLKE